MPKVQFDQRCLFYTEGGSGSSPPLLFLCGLGGDHRAFSVPMRFFSARFRTIALDHRDVGQSDRVDGPYTTSDMAEDVAGLLKAIGVPKAHVVGHSLGGLVAQQLAIHHPEQVRSLILASTHAGADDWRKAVLESWVQMRYKCEPGEFTRLTLPWLVAPEFYHHPAQIDGLIRFAEQNPWPQDAAAFERQARAAVAHRADAGLGDVSVPTLVLVGERDIVNPPGVAAELAARLPNARMQIMPGVGHLPHVEAGQDFRQAVVEFLSSD